MDYLAEQSCHRRRQRLFSPACIHWRTGRSRRSYREARSYLRPGTPGSPSSCTISAIPLAEFGKNHLGDHTRPFRPRTASRSSGGTCITSTPCRRELPPTSQERSEQTNAAPCKEHAGSRPSRGPPEP